MKYFYFSNFFFDKIVGQIQSDSTNSSDAPEMNYFLNKLFMAKSSSQIPGDRRKVHKEINTHASWLSSFSMAGGYRPHRS